MGPYIGLIVNVGTIFVMLVGTYFIGGLLERRHYQQIRSREQANRDFLVVNFPYVDAAWNIAECSAPFEAAYAVCCAAGPDVRNVCEPMITNDPPRSAIASAAAPSTCIVPTTLVESTRCQSSSLVRVMPPITLGVFACVPVMSTYSQPSSSMRPA